MSVFFFLVLAFVNLDGAFDDDASIKQLNGAAGFLKRINQITLKDGTPGPSLPPLNRRKIHLIAVALGSKDNAILHSGDEGRGYIHVMNERAVADILQELDTISDFINYFDAKESTRKGGTKFLTMGSESNQLAFYLLQNRSFPKDVDLIHIDDTVWEGYVSRPDYKRRKEADEESYRWDEFVDCLTDGIEGWTNHEGRPEANAESVFRLMAAETRFNRRLLAKQFKEFVQRAHRGEMVSRICHGVNSTTYVLVYYPGGETESYRAEVMQTRMFIARHMLGKGEDYIGIGFGKEYPEKGFCTHVAYMNFEGWNAETDRRAKIVQEQFGFYKEMKFGEVTEDEYPKVPTQ